jgi:hypothetical protein
VDPAAEGLEDKRHGACARLLEQIA